jgi:hypothetical protein
MKTITWKVVLDDNNRIASLENAINFPQDSVESHLLIIGLLENMKQKHLEKLNTQFEKTIRKDDESGC